MQRVVARIRTLNVFLGIAIRNQERKVLLVRYTDNDKWTLPHTPIGDRFKGFGGSDFFDEAQCLCRQQLCGSFKDIHRKHSHAGTGENRSSELHFFLGEFVGEPVEGPGVHSILWLPFDECITRDDVSRFAIDAVPFLKMVQ